MAQKQTQNQEATNSKAKGQLTILQAMLMICVTLVISVGGWYLAGKYYFWSDIDTKRVNEQLEFYKQKVLAEPNNPENRINLGYTYFLKGKNDAAIKEYNQALELKKDYYDAYYNLGLVYEEEKRYDDALEMFQKTVELSPRDYKGHLHKGIVYRQLKMYKEALDSLNTANQLLPGNADIIYHIGQIAEDQGDTAAAIDIYKDALTYDPLYKDAAEALERLSKK